MFTITASLFQDTEILFSTAYKKCNKLRRCNRLIHIKSNVKCIRNSLAEINFKTFVTVNQDFSLYALNFVILIS